MRAIARLRPDRLRQRAGHVAEDLKRRAVPNHWTFLLGTVSMSCLVVLVLTGLVLMLFYDPSNASVRYQGSYPLLKGVEVSRAFDSTMHISFEVPGGLLVRQAHHWAALLLPATLLLQLLGVFFTGGFRRPRRLSWVLLCLCFLLVLAAGWSGYALPDDMLSGTGQRIVEGITIGIPVIGPWLTALLYGDGFPGEVVKHLYWIHLLLVPLALLTVLVVRLRLAHRHKPAQFRGPGHIEANVVGAPLRTAFVKASGLFLVTAGLVFVMAATMTVSPIWHYGPSTPASAAAGSQPDWYTGFLDGALRLVPPGWETHWWGRTWALGVLVPQAAVGLFLTLVVAYPFLEARLTGDTAEHHLLDRPRNAPVRTATGVAGVVFFTILWAAGSTDLLVTQLHLSFEGVTALLRILLVLGPTAAFVVTYGLCRGLQARDRELVADGVETGIIIRDPDGGYREVRRPLDPYERWRLHAPAAPASLQHADPDVSAGGRADPTRHPVGAVPGTAPEPWS